MVDTKNALEEADGDVDKAVEILRLKGAKGNAKRADRSTSEGLVAAVDNGDGNATLIELACETDFVAKNDQLHRASPTRSRCRRRRRADSVEAALAAPAGGKTVADVISDEAAIIGEKVELRRIRLVTGDKFAIYLHKTARTCPRRSASSSAYAGDDAETARSVAQHISFANPTYLSRDEVPARSVEKEREIVERDLPQGGQARGRPPEDHRGSRRRVLQAGRTPRPGLREGQQAVRRARSPRTPASR